MNIVTETSKKELAVNPVLEEKHRETIVWFSTIKLWQKELTFFQSMLEETAHLVRKPEDRKKVSRFQNLFIYYHAELLLELRTKLRNHETLLMNILTKGAADQDAYLKDHEPLMTELAQFSKVFTDLKKDFFTFVERTKGEL